MGAAVPAFLAEFRRSKAAPAANADSSSGAGTQPQRVTCRKPPSVAAPAANADSSSGAGTQPQRVTCRKPPSVAAPVSRHDAEQAVRELRSILRDSPGKVALEQNAAAATAHAALFAAHPSPQPLSPAVSVPNSPAPPRPAALDLSGPATANGDDHGDQGDQDDDDDGIGGFFSSDARRRRQMLALSAESESDSDDGSDDEGGPESPPAAAGARAPRLHPRSGRHRRATVLRGGMLAACWANRMLVRLRARKAGRRLGPRSTAPLIPQRWLEKPQQEVQAEEQTAYQAYLRLQMIKESELSLNFSERILVEIPFWIIAPAALVVYVLLQLPEALDAQGEL